MTAIIIILPVERSERPGLRAQQERERRAGRPAPGSRPRLISFNPGKRRARPDRSRLPRGLRQAIERLK